MSLHGDVSAGSPPPPIPPPLLVWIAKKCSTPVRLLLRPPIIGVLVMIIVFTVIPALVPPEFGVDPDSSLSSFDLSASHVTTQWNLSLSVKNPSSHITVNYSRMNVVPSQDDQLLTLPWKRDTFQVMAQLTLPIVSHLRTGNREGSLKSGQVNIDLGVKAKRKLQLGTFLVVVIDVQISCTDVTFTAPSNGGGNGRILLQGTLCFHLDIFSRV